MLNAIVIGFVAAAIAPWVVRRAGTAAGWWLALVPAGLAVAVASQLPRIAGVPLWSSTVRDDLDGCYDADSHTLGTPDRPPERGLRTVRDDVPRVGDGDDQPGARSHKRRG